MDPTTIQGLLSNLRPDQRSAMWDLYRKSINELSSVQNANRTRLAGLFQDTADAIQGDIQTIFRRNATDTWNMTDMRRLGRDRILLDQIRNRIAALGVEFRQATEQGSIEMYRQAYIDGTYRLDVLTPNSVDIKTGILPDREILTLLDQPFAGAKFSDRIGLISDEMAQNIKFELMRSMMAQEGWQDAARRIRSEMGTVGRAALWRADTIARTELARAQELANAHLYEQNADAIDKVIWVSHPGACDVCTELNGIEIAEQDGYPPEASHPNCECGSMAIPKGWDELAQPGENDVPVSVTPRAEWAQSQGLESVA